MVEAKVIKKFRDKETQQIHKVGETLTLSDKRFKEIQKVGNFLATVSKTDSEAADEQPDTADTKTAAKKAKK